MSKFTNPFIPSHFDLVVTRHAGLVEWLIREGHITEDTPVVGHAHADRHQAEVREANGVYDVYAGRKCICAEDIADPDMADAIADEHNAANVRGKHVLGVLPHHLSCEAASITEVQLDIPPELRGVEFTAEQTGEYARGLHTYRVTRADAASRPAVAIARALDEAPICNGASIKFLSNDHAALLEVADIDGYGSIQVDLYDGAMRISPPSGGGFGPWIDPHTGERWRMAVNRDGRVQLVGGYDEAGTERKIAAISEADQVREDFDAWLEAWWPRWQAEHDLQVEAMSADIANVLRAAFEAGVGLAR